MATWYTCDLCHARKQESATARQVTIREGVYFCCPRCWKATGKAQVIDRLLILSKAQKIYHRALTDLLP